MYTILHKISKINSSKGQEIYRCIFYDASMSKGKFLNVVQFSIKVKENIRLLVLCLKSLMSCRTHHLHRSVHAAHS